MHHGLYCVYVQGSNKNKLHLLLLLLCHDTVRVCVSWFLVQLILLCCVGFCLCYLNILKHVFAYFVKCWLLPILQSSPSPSFITLLCYLLPIGLALTHCSLTFCQTWFLTSDLYILFFLLCCHAVSPSPQSCLSPFAINPLLAACEFSKRFFRDPIFPFPSHLSSSRHLCLFGESVF